MTTTEKPNIQEHLVSILESVADPEIPVLSVLDLGVIREAVEVEGMVQIKLSPTYSGCPATDMMASDIKAAFAQKGKKARVDLVLAPAWTTDWMSEKGKQKMEAYGIAPPLEPLADKEALLGNQKLVKCPQCGSTNTHLVSQFGATACKALFQCDNCQEPFDYFKCLK
ncbi:MAG TPA: phenylacetate-CoA oxygenase subunit PaaJ [Flavobacteriaceae bacterium]|nr:phenylacetate-CoA oxygenase subunit PaaJ [Flavobacteriaceae bacterium]HPF12023.1 phenylacetate-CoA oxygenase subunit PaaJ [Flavobacteriaceae bacterium]HQU21398.1 phenylacetate-CoA oxygenase subunit PaaJ [Flavobacteriaceae bacterium]HQU65142.1 phenylacetate-CoA oxygenase subunit PaaJ [Flavobacteriaceae bacterium]HRW45293.1 phenylacetate-CoA oxygenase subunit PaaJ [Flavobacteriaceae bacterium]